MLLINSLDYFQLDCVELLLYDPQDTLSDLVDDDHKALPGLTLTRRRADLQSLYTSTPDVRLVSTSTQKLPVFRNKALRSAAMLPLMRQGKLVGSLHFGASGHQRFTDDKSTDFISHLASIIAVCLENVVNQEQLHRLSMYDTLTQVKNRRAFRVALDEEVSRAARGGDPLSVLFVDLDHFKRVNDNYGHLLGDKVLKEVAGLMAGLLRKTDHVCRYGGEEFALVLPNCGQQRAREVAERIRLQVSELPIIDDTVARSEQLEDYQTVHVTLSIGVCCWLPGAELNQVTEPEIARFLVAASDKGVYQSKAAGRNCVHYNSLLDDSL